MSFKIGDIVKRHKGNFHYKIVNIDERSRYGKYVIYNLTNGCTYNEKLTTKVWTVCTYHFIKNKKLKKLKFTNGV
jgi:hypothetical protein